MKQFFGTFSNERRCRFFKCEEGSISSGDVDSKCVFQGSFPWEPLQTLMKTGKKAIMKACTSSYLRTVKTCEADLGEVYILNNMQWLEDCTQDPNCQTVAQVPCQGSSCTLPSDPCTSQSGSSNQTESSSPNPSPSSSPDQDPETAEDEHGDEEYSGFGENDDVSFSSSEDDEARNFTWQDQVYQNMRKFLLGNDEADHDDSPWNAEGRRLMLMALNKPSDQVDVRDIWSTGVESIRMTGELGQEIHQLQKQVTDLSVWSWRFNLGLLLPTSLAVATSLLILGNFCYKSHKFISERVNRVLTEKSAQRNMQSEKAKNLEALDIAVRIESMRMQLGKEGLSDNQGVVKLTDCDGRQLGVYNPTQLVPDHVQSASAKKTVPSAPSLPVLQNVSTSHFVANDHQEDKITQKTVFLQDDDDEEYSIEAWKRQAKFNLYDDY